MGENLTCSKKKKIQEIYKNSKPQQLILRLLKKIDTTKDDCTNRTYNSNIENTKEDTINKTYNCSYGAEHW